MNKILIVDDEESIISLLKYTFEQAGFSVVVAYNGTSTFKIVEEEKPDLILLDIMLPEITGFEICNKLRLNKNSAKIPIIFLSARTREVDKLLALKLGADDYVTKPFSPRELVARVKSKLRRSNDEGIPIQGSSTQLVEIHGLVIKPSQYEAFIEGQKLNLSKKEFELLKLLASNSGKILKRDFIINTIWGRDYGTDSRTLDVHIRYLRQKIEKAPQNPQYIETIRNLGYRFKG